MTALDNYQPEGEPIHPYDVYDLLCALAADGVAVYFDIVAVNDSPPAADEADYTRNRHKIGSVIEIKGKRYFQTTSAPYKSTTFIE